MAVKNTAQFWTWIYKFKWYSEVVDRRTLHWTIVCAIFHILLIDFVYYHWLG